ncbi:Flp family type IVb pilin [Petroclostridium sp. X23]|jgi:Flp pilus assembly pilin Flp|uniref:Flp family type IVb pilin n=1 Tax=Petroclostridium sp. X23 TaxID=3045146 RepID=UPI0024ACAC00|nr:Flp family type IVb pilin [Petroclostridium sp. X23]WHH60542.1 Flp family type IVb pilin [Petroclostridium sp. X23]
MLVYFYKIIQQLSSEKGQGMVEYGLLLVMIALVVIAGMTNLAGAVSDFFTSFSTWFD